MLWNMPANSEIFSTGYSVNSYLEDDKYKLHSTNVDEKSVNIIYHLRGHKKNTMRLITCIYSLIEKKTVCVKP